MLYLPYFNIDLKREYQYSYILHILVRIHGLSGKRKITRDIFISSCIDNNISKRSAYRYWEKGAYKNMFIKYVSKEKDYLYITGKDTFETIIEKVPSNIYNQIRTITDLKDFIHCSRLGRTGISKKTNKKMIYTGKGLLKIATDNNSTISTICNRNKRAKKFGLEYKNRYGVYNNLLVRLPNIYKSSVRIIRNKYCAVNIPIRDRKKPIENVHFAHLYNVLNSKTFKCLRYATSENYELINPILFPKII